MTKGRRAAKSALSYAQKLLGLERSGEKKQFSKLGADMRSLIGEEPNAKLSDYNDKIKEAFADNEDALTILSYANMLEDYMTSYGQHAAGLICIQNDMIENYIPIMATTDDDGNDTFVVQADMNECEAQLGFIKFDFLGLKNLNIITKAMELIKKRHNVTFNPYKLPFEKEVFETILAKGDTNFIFQLESDGMKGMLRELHPTCFGDIILAVSVYRPGPMDFIPDIIASKNNGEESEFVKRFPMLKEVYEETYGYPVYQEQVMKTFTICAGFSTGKADIVRRYMSKKKEDKLAKIRPEFLEGCNKNGIQTEDAEWLFDQLMPFAKYGFNKSHAAAYSLVTYITAWLKYHFPLEYLCAAISVQLDKTSQFLNDCKNRNIAIHRPDINMSESEFSIYNEGILVGLSAIKGLKSEADEVIKERENGLFETLEDVIERLSVKSNSLKALVLSGACDTFINDRNSASAYAEKYKEVYQEVKELEEKVQSIDEQIQVEEDKKKLTSLNRSLKAASDKLDKARKELAVIPKPSKLALSATKRLALESQFLGMWVTGNPLEDYDVSGYKKIHELEYDQTETIAGVITNVKEITTKATGQRMAICTLIDADGESLKTVCFPNQYDSNKSFIDEGKIVCIKGEVKFEDEAPELIVWEISNLNKVADSIIVSVENISEYKKKVEPVLERHKDSKGVAISISNKQMKELRKVTFKVAKECLEDLKAISIECA